MEFEKYVPGKHGNLFPDSFSVNVVKPSDIEDYRGAVKQALEDIEGIFGSMAADFSVVIGEIDAGLLEEEFDGDILHYAYFQAYSLGKKAHSQGDRNIIFLATSQGYEYWRPGLKYYTVHEEAHQEFYVEKPDMMHEIWESIIFEGHAIHRSEKVREQKDYRWEGHRGSFPGSAAELKQELDKNREWEGDLHEREDSSPLFSMGGERWQQAEGYIAAFEIYRDIVERNGMDVDGPVRRSEAWQKEEKRKSIDRLYS
ncbi:MAG: hypothetical protein ABEJ07_00490 [Candidatus Nanohaloarchaea archaeon]